MRANCMFCSKPLGSNEVVEHFPVGRRLAFDSHKGRLWVVCKRCERWNLTPLEERWEAVETCEILFRDTRVRVSSENIGLAKLSEGLELVRIGPALRPEFAAWRYGDQFGRRRKRAILVGTGAFAILAGASLAPALMTGGGAPTWLIWNSWYTGRTIAKVKDDWGRVYKLNATDLKGTRIRTRLDGEGFGLELRKGKKRMKFWGEDAERLAGQVLPGINRAGGKDQTVQDAVSEIERFGHPDAFLEDVTRGHRFTDRRDVPGYINKMPKPTQLALEMALHEEQERRAMEGELWLLEERWRAAEEIAAIADDLLVPPEAEEFIRKHRKDAPDGGEPH